MRPSARLRVLPARGRGGAPRAAPERPAVPRGPIHGGYLTVLFNAGAAGYAVTGHPVGAGRAGASPGPRARARALTTLVVVAATTR